MPITRLSKITEVRKIDLRSTFISDYERCPRYALFRHRAGLTPKGGSTPALQRGDVFHSIIAAILRGVTTAQAEGDALWKMRESANEATAAVGPSGFLPNGLTPEAFIKENESNVRVAIAMSRAYCKFFGVRDGVIGELDIAGGNSSAPYGWVEMLIQSTCGTGKLDAVVEDKNGDLYVVDHKTCGWNIQSYARTLPLAAQSLLYPLLLAQKMMDENITGCDVKGIIYNIIKTPTIRCCKTDDFDLEKYAKRVETWYEENPDDVMLRTVIHPSRELIEFSKKRFDKAAKACVSLPVINNFPATGGSACQAYNTLCPYIGFCTSDTARWPEELQRFDKHFREDDDNADDSKD